MAFLILIGLVALVAAQPCNIVNNTNGWNPQCTSETAPRCRTDPQLGIATCFQCSSSCDCEIGQYCSTAPGSFGICVDFDLEGNDCLPFSNGEIRDLDFPAALKCAAFWTNVTTNVTTIDFRGTCVEGVCRICSATANDCGFDTIGGYRVCGSPVPGSSAVLPTYSLHSYHASVWGAAYALSPRNVWFPVFWVLTAVAVLIQIIQLCFLCKSGGRSSSNRTTELKDSTPAPAPAAAAAAPPSQGQAQPSYSQPPASQGAQPGYAAPPSQGMYPPMQAPGTQPNTYAYTEPPSREN